MNLRKLICLALLVPALAVLAAACEEDSPTGPSGNPNQVRFIAQLAPANEVPAIASGEASGIGTAAITLDATAATATFQVAVSGFPSTTQMNIAHIHQAPAGTNGAIVVDTTLTSGQFVLTNGAGSFTRTVPASAAVVQGIINNPAGFYFNIHSTLHPGGVARGQLVKVD